MGWALLASCRHPHALICMRPRVFGAIADQQVGLRETNPLRSPLGLRGPTTLAGRKKRATVGGRCRPPSGSLTCSLARQALEPRALEAPSWWPNLAQPCTNQLAQLRSIRRRWLGELARQFGDSASPNCPRSRSPAGCARPSNGLISMANQ